MLVTFPPALQQPAPESPEALRQRLSSLFQTQKWNELADAIEALNPAQRGAYLGPWFEALERAQRWERLAEVCGAVAGQLDPKAQRASYVDVQRRRLKALQKLGRSAEQGLVCEQLGDAGEITYYLFGMDLARAAHDWDGMERMASRFLTARPQDSAGFLTRGEALAHLMRFPEAEAALQQGLTLQPKDAFGWSNLGRCQNERKAWAEAEVSLLKALELNPKLLEARYNLGRCRFELHRYRDAVEDFQAALVLAPEDAVLKENLHQAQRYASLDSKTNKNNK